MLKIENLHVYYGNIHALKGINMEINEGEIVTLIGANGAGKTTTLRAVSNIVDAKEGKIEFLGENITGKKATDIVKMGLIHVPEGRRVFAQMSVMENLELGAYLRKDRDGIKRDMDMVFNMFPRLYERKNQLSGTMSGGEQQMLAIGRGIMSKPKLLILDEPSMGLAPLLVKEIFEIVKKVNRESKITVLLVEQNANMALKIADRAYVIETGKVVMSGPAKEIMSNSAVKEAYLG